MTKKFDMKNIEHARNIARKYKDADDIKSECYKQLDEMGLDYNARNLIIRDPDIEFVEIKSCGIKYLTDKPINMTYSALYRTKVTPQPNGKALVEVED